jgi:hypothetical protein
MRRLTCSGAAQPHEILSILAPLDALEEAHAHQRVAMNAHEVCFELLFE